KKQQEAADYDKWFKQQVQIGLNEANAGKLIPHEDVTAEFAARRAATLAKLAAKNED
ncbi:hypothetical protein JL980_20500, partial [Acinetobacter baumannii]|nr:hypothetical protein [Acinetobacter baumannii]